MPDTHADPAPVSTRFSLDSVIEGLAADLSALRAGKISLEDARARAELAKQLFNGVRITINARKMLENSARKISFDNSEAL